MKLVHNQKQDGIVVEGHIGTWYVIDSIQAEDGKYYFLLEHEEYGDEAACVIVDEDCNLIMEDVWNGFEDLEDAQAAAYLLGENVHFISFNWERE